MCRQLSLAQRQSRGQPFERADVVFAWTCQSMDVTVGWSENGILARRSEIRHWSLSAYQDELTKFLQLLDGHFEGVLNSLHRDDTGATFEARERVGS